MTCSISAPMLLEGLGHDIFQRMGARRLLGQKPCFDLFVHPRMIVCEQ